MPAVAILAAPPPAAPGDVALLVQALQALPTPVCVADRRLPGRPVVYANEAFGELLGRPAAALQGAHADAWLAPEVDEDTRAALGEALDAGRPCDLVLPLVDAAGAVRWLRVQLAPVVDAAGEATHLVASAEDVSAERRNEAALRELVALRLAADGAARRHFEARVEAALRVDGRATAVLAIVLRPGAQDDTAATIEHEARLAALNARWRDVLPAGTTGCRLHEGCILLLVPLGSASAADLAAQLRAALVEIVPDAAYGWALPGPDGARADTLIDAAQRAALGQGREPSEAEALAADLAAALGRGQFHLVYQPQVRVPTGEIVALEALLRWTHPTRGLVPTGDFIGLLEASAQIGPATRWIVETALADLARWERGGYGGLRMAVNMPPSVLADESFAAFVVEALGRHQLAPYQLEIELTERSLVDATGPVVRALQRLRAQGVAVAIDDFGTGYSNLSHLATLPLDALKVDMRFAKGALTNPADAAICRMTVELARALGLRTVAEGIETEGGLHFFADLRCDLSQGWLFARGVTADEIDRLLARPNLLPAGVGAAPAGPERHLLLLDDEENVLRAMRRLFRPTGYRVHATTDPDEAFELLARHPVGVVVSDQRMPRMSGTDFLRRVKGLYPATRRMVLSGYTDLQSITDAINEGAISKFMTKPWSDAQLLAAVEEAFASFEMAAEKQRLQGELEEANENLARLLETTQQRATHGATALDVLHATLAAVPMPIVGVDESGMVALSNPAADALLGAGLPLVGSALPLAADASAHDHEGRHYRVVREAVRLGRQRFGTVVSFVEDHR